MGRFLTLERTSQEHETALTAADDISAGRWFAVYGLLFAAAAVPLWMIVQQQGLSWHGLWNDFRSAFAMILHHPFSSAAWGQLRAIAESAFAMIPTEAKLLVLGIYLSLCCTFLPLNTGWIVAAMAMRDVAISPNVWTVTLAVAVVGGLGSTIANLNDYYIFTLMLRHRHVAKLRHTRLYQASAKWFAKSPFFILTIFSFVPIPVDVIRLLAITCRYGRVKFAAANFIGRSIRYGVFAFVTFWYNLGWIAPVFLLALAAALAGLKGLHSLYVKFSAGH